MVNRTRARRITGRPQGRPSAHPFTPSLTMNIPSMKPAQRSVPAGNQPPARFNRALTVRVPTEEIIRARRPGSNPRS
jgi:hypothetical protein